MKFQMLRTPRTSSCALIVAVLCAMGFTNQARADLIFITSNLAASTEGLGSFNGSVDYQFNSGNTGTLVITLTNTTAAPNAGTIAGFIFNVGGSDPNASANLITSTYAALLNAPGQSGVPFGTPYDAGAALGGTFLGGGSPNGGIEAGGTGAFTFQVTANDASTLTALDFLAGGSYEHNFLVRFKGFSVGDGSDKVPAMLVPAPSALALLGLAGLVGGRRRRRE